MQRPINSRNQTLIVSIAVVLLSLPFGGSMVSVADPVDDVESLADQVSCGLDVGPVFGSDCGQTESWVVNYDGPESGEDYYNGMAMSPDGTAVYVTGQSEEVPASNRWDYATAAYDTTTGEEVWAARYDAGPMDSARAVAVDPTGSIVYVTGFSGSGGQQGDIDFATVAYDAATGDQIWVARYDAPIWNNQLAHDLAVGPDGSVVYVTGYEGGSYDFVTAAYNATTGDEIWVTHSEGPGLGHGGGSARSLVVSSDSSALYVTGQSAEDYLTIAYDAATGDEIWVARYNGLGDGQDRAKEVVLAPDDSIVYVTGESAGLDGGTGFDYDYATVAYDADTGDEIWVARHDGPGDDAVTATAGYNAKGDKAKSLEVGPDGSVVYVTGESSSSTTGPGYATVAYDADTGDEIWVARYDGLGMQGAWPGGGDRGLGLGISPDGSTVYVVGDSFGLGTGRDATTVAYDTATGNELWVHRYNDSGNDNDGVYEAIVSPDGSTVYVGGTSRGLDTDADFLIMALPALP